MQTLIFEVELLSIQDKTKDDKSKDEEDKKSRTEERRAEEVDRILTGGVPGVRARPARRCVLHRIAFAPLYLPRYITWT